MRIMPSGFFLGKKDLGRKGFELQFNWLFVLIAGAIFIAFFISLMRNHSSDVEQASTLNAKQELDSLFRVNRASVNTQKVLSFSKRLDFSTSNISGYFVDGSDVWNRYDYSVIFAPKFLDGDELMIKTSSFKAPFNVMPFIFLANNDLEFVFVGSDAVLSAVSLAMPENITKKSLAGKSEMASFKNNNYDHTVFVFTTDSFGGSMPLLANFQSPADKERVYAVVIDAAGGFADAYGQVSFYNYSKGSLKLEGQSGFIGIELLLGAVISHNQRIYNREFRKAMNRLGLLADLQVRRVAEYSQSTQESCKAYYDSMSESLSYIKMLSASGRLMDDDILNMFNQIINIKQLNTALLQKTDCPLLY
ncbi:MAG: hypothetical protein V1866_02665 [archaeon]